MYITLTFSFTKICTPFATTFIPQFGFQFYQGKRVAEGVGKELGVIDAGYMMKRE